MQTGSHSENAFNYSFAVHLLLTVERCMKNSRS